MFKDSHFLPEVRRGCRAESVYTIGKIYLSGLNEAVFVRIIGRIANSSPLFADRAAGFEAAF
jgi:hypothetical protein